MRHLSVYKFLEKYGNNKKATAFVEKTRWPGGIVCVHCESDRVSRKKNRLGIYQCKDCRKDFSVKHGTIFERSAVPLSKWLYMIYLLQTNRKGISSISLSKQIGVTQKTAWFMLHRIREACKQRGAPKLAGVISCDEAYFGGEARYKHYDKRPKHKGLTYKTIVQGLRSKKKLDFS